MENSYKCHTCKKNERGMFGKDEPCEEPLCLFYPHKILQTKAEQIKQQPETLIINEKHDVKTLLIKYLLETYLFDNAFIFSKTKSSKPYITDDEIEDLLKYCDTMIYNEPVDNNIKYKEYFRHIYKRLDSKLNEIYQNNIGK